MFHPSKKLGQNFLINKGIVDKIIVAAELSKDDTVLEIGPGKGALTEKLIEHAGRVIAVEYDRQLFELLKEKFKGVKNLELINADILSLYPIPYTLYPNYKLIANIPYNITGQIFRKFLSPPSLSLRAPYSGRGNLGIASAGKMPRNDAKKDNRPQMFVVMVQKEVGERLLGKKNRSILSLLADLYGKTEKVCDVSPGSFNPSPKVASMVVKIVASPSSLLPLAKGEEGWGMERKILHLAKIGFSSKRKKLVSNLSTGLKIGKDRIKEIFNKVGLNENARAEELSKDDWLKLAEII
ncbi:MAG: rRNA adenine dimethyltransferase family protein [bacterium]